MVILTVTTNILRHGHTNWASQLFQAHFYFNLKVSSFSLIIIDCFFLKSVLRCQSDSGTEVWGEALFTIDWQQVYCLEILGDKAPCKHYVLLGTSEEWLCEAPLWFVLVLLSDAHIRALHLQVMTKLFSAASWAWRQETSVWWKRQSASESRIAFAPLLCNSTALWEGNSLAWCLSIRYRVSDAGKNSEVGGE